MSAPTATVGIMATPNQQIRIPADDWRLSVQNWLILSIAAMMIVFVVASAATLATTTDPWLTIAQWTLGSSAHVSWSAPLLVTAAFAFAAICAAPMDEVAGFSLPRQYFGFASLGVTTVLTAWALSAIVTLTQLDAIAEVKADAPSQFAAISGLFLVAPIGIVAGLTAGRFQIGSLPQRLAGAKRTAIRARDAVADLTLREANERVRLIDRTLVTLAPFAIGSAVFVASAALAGTTPGIAPEAAYTVALMSTFIYGMSAFASFCAATNVAAPRTDFQFTSRGGQKLTRLGRVAQIVVVIATLLPWLWTAAMTWALFAGGAQSSFADLARFWGAIAITPLAAILYSLFLRTPLSVRTQLALSLKTSRRWLVMVEKTETNLEAQFAQQYPSDKSAETGVSRGTGPLTRARQSAAARACRWVRRRASSRARC